MDPNDASKMIFLRNEKLAVKMSNPNTPRGIDSMKGPINILSATDTSYMPLSKCLIARAEKEQSVHLQRISSTLQKSDK